MRLLNPNISCSGAIHRTFVAQVSKMLVCLSPLKGFATFKIRSLIGFLGMTLLCHFLLFTTFSLYADEPKISVSYPEKAYSFASKLEITISGQVENEEGLGSISIGKKVIVIDGYKKAYFAEKIDLQPGKNIITIKATDRKEKNPIEQDLTILYDDKPPKIIVTEPTERAIDADKSEMLFKGSVTDDNTVWFLSIADNAPQDKIYKPKIDFSQTVKLKTGQNTYKITAKDMGGNESVEEFTIQYNPELLNIMVDKFEGIDASAKEADFVANAVGSALQETNAFTIVVPDAAQLIKLQSQSNDNCHSKECAIKRGELLGASKVVMGILQNFGGEYHITVKMVDIKSGAMEFNKKMVAKTQKDIDSVVTALANALASQKGTK